MVGGDQGTASGPRLDHHDDVGQRGDDPVAGRKRPAANGRARRELRDDEALAQQPGMEGPLGPRIRDVGAAAEHRDGPAARLQRARVSGRVDAERQAADHGHAGRREAPTQVAGDAQSIGAGPASAHHRHQRLGGQLAQTPRVGREENGGRAGQVVQRGRVAAVVPADRVEPGGSGGGGGGLGVEALVAGPQPAPGRPGRRQRGRQGGVGEGERGVQGVHAAHPLQVVSQRLDQPGAAQAAGAGRHRRALRGGGQRRAHAAAGSTAGSWRKASARRTWSLSVRSLPARSAIVRATRTTRSIPRALR